MRVRVVAAGWYSASVVVLMHVLVGSVLSGSVYASITERDSANILTTSLLVIPLSVGLLIAAARAYVVVTPRRLYRSLTYGFPITRSPGQILSIGDDKHTVMVTTPEGPQKLLIVSTHMFVGLTKLRRLTTRTIARLEQTLEDLPIEEP